MSVFHFRSSILLTISLVIAPGIRANALSAAHLTCESQLAPLGLDTLRPRLGWQCTAADHNERAVRQTAYRILVATSTAKLAANQGDLWDTGKISTDRSQGIDYRGKALISGEECLWKVMLWDAEGRASAWSSPTRWTMGLLNPSDWSAKWIAAPASVGKDEEAPLLRKKFHTDSPIKRATVYVSGLGFYELHLNGHKIGDHELDPGFTRYDKRVLYVTYDVTRELRAGDNSFGVTLGNGWFNHAVKAAWDFDKAVWRGRPRLLLQLNLEYANDKHESVVTDESWLAHRGPLVDDELLTGEQYDARREIVGWDRPECDERGWSPAQQVAPPAGSLSSETFPAIKVSAAIKPVTLTEPKPGIFLFDFGQNMAGIEQLTVSGPAGTTITLQFGEELHKDGTLSQDKIKIHTHQDGFQTDTYTLRGGSTEVWRPKFTYHGFRYAQVTGFPGKPSLASLRALVMHAGFEAAGSFTCSNPVLNKIQAATQWAYVSNFYSSPTDCPTREKNGWMGDAQLAAETGLYNYSAGVNYAKWIRDMQDAQKESGELPGIVPTGGWGYAWGNGPAWDSAYVLIPWDLFLFTGDRHILEEQYVGIKRYVDYVDVKSPNHIANFGLNDWAPFKAETPTDITSTGYFYRDTLIAARIAHILGRNADEKRYAQLAADIRDTFNKTFYHSGLYGTGSQTALSCALYQGLAPDTVRPQVLANLADQIVKNGVHMDCGILGAKYIMHALSDGGNQELAYKLAAQTTLPSWGFWVEGGSTTLLEQWNDHSDGDLSRNHIMFGDISAWCYETLGGIKPDEEMPGFKRVVISPQISGKLTHVRATHLSAYGEIVSEWRRDGNTLTLEVTIPSNTSAIVYVPSRQDGTVLESGRPAAESHGVTEAGFRQGAAVFRVGSGTYRFTSPL